MLEDIIEFYRSNNFEDIIVTSNIKLLIDKIIIEKSKNLNIVEDARAATFFALGRINITREPVMLIMSSDELANSLTGITEANYQYLPLIIISIGDKEDYINEECFKYVTKKVISDNKNGESIIQELGNYFDEKWFKPLLIQIKEKKEVYKDMSNNKEYYDIVDCVVNSANSNAQIFIEEAVDEDIVNIAKSKDISLKLRKSLYGVVSSFLGHAAVNDNKQYLITTYDKISRDINAFNMRGIKNNIVVIYIKRNDINHKFTSWFECNGFDFTVVKSILEIEKKLSSPNKKPIIIEYLVNERR
ncbi:hypothetical protein [Clostridium isatidis]|uniref:hypothetical protein n=1 Tax=Clostridium isatidis TaxID=182773 RepID=UPI003AAEF871